jgi:hypothetical protein
MDGEKGTSASFKNSNRFVFVFALGAGFGTNLVPGLQSRPAKRAEKQRMIDKAWLVFFEIDKTDGHVDDIVGPNRDQRLEVAAFQSFLQLGTARPETRLRAC